MIKAGKVAQEIALSLHVHRTKAVIPHPLLHTPCVKVFKQESTDQQAFVLGELAITGGNTDSIETPECGHQGLHNMW